MKRLLIENDSLDCFIFSENLEGEAREWPKHYTLEVAAPTMHKAAADVGDGSKIRFAKPYLKLIWKRADQLVDGIKKNRLNMLIACTGNPLDIPATMVASLRTGKPFFVYLFDDATYQWTSPRLRKICDYIESLWSKLAAGAICPNQSLADEYLQRRNLKVKILPNPSSERRDINQIANSQPANEDIEKKSKLFIPGLSIMLKLMPCKIW